jgi:hypothetical protein
MKKARKRFFVVSETRLRHDEKKKQKTFSHWSPVDRRWHTPNREKFFASFFQKRSASLSFELF